MLYELLKNPQKLKNTINKPLPYKGKIGFFLNFGWVLKQIVVLGGFWGLGVYTVSGSRAPSGRKEAASSLHQQEARIVAQLRTE